MEKKSVLICEYCGQVIDQDDRFVHEVQRYGSEIEHEGYYHQECFINSMIKDLEELDFQIIRPRSEINNDLKENPLFSQTLPLDPELVKDGLNLFGEMMNLQHLSQKNHILPIEKQKTVLEEVSKKLSEEDAKKIQELKEKAFDKVTEKNKISPDFIGDDPEKMKEGTITPLPKKIVNSQKENGKEKSKTKSSGTGKKK